MNRFFRLEIRHLALVLIVAALSLTGCDAGDSQSPTSSDTQSDVAPSQNDLSGDELVTVPSVVELDGDEANGEIESNDLTVSFVPSTDDEDINDPRIDATGCTVVDQDPAADEEVDPGSEVELSLDCRQVDWENQDGDEWDLYTDAFDRATEEGCAALFGETDDGSLYLEDTEYTDSDCVGTYPADAADDPPSDVPDDPESQGGHDGFDEGCPALFDMIGSTELYWGQDYYSVDDCTAMNPY